MTIDMLGKLRSDLRKISSPEKAKTNAWFFKTGPGQYGEGDQFIGVTVPQQRSLARKYQDLSFEDITSLSHSPIHEERLLSLFILVGQFKKADPAAQKKIYEFYLSNTKQINNWDLVDLSADKIVGSFLEDKPKDILKKLAKSESLWERRIAMIATFHYIKKGDPKLALEIAEILVNDKHDLIQKAVGWSLREIGQKCGENYLTDFLDNFAATMPRTALRYAIEHFSTEKRAYYLKLDKN